jgi:hypothetical protein
MEYRFGSIRVNGLNKVNSFLSCGAFGFLFARSREDFLCVYLF